MYYAQLNPDGICVGVTEPSAPLTGPQFIPVDGLHGELIGMKWNGTGWEPVEEGAES